MRRIGESELIINADGSIFHLHIKPEELAEKVIVVGDPSRVEMIASHFDKVDCRNTSREFHSVTGYYKGVRITALSTGIGCDNIDIVMTELDALVNIDFATRQEKEHKTRLTVLRIGTSGSIQPDIPLGSFVFTRMAVGFDGLLNWYGNREHIAESDIEKAFTEHAGWTEYLPIPYFVRNSRRLADAFADSTVPGMTIAAGGFYGPQCRVVRLPLAIPDLMDKIESFRHGEWRFTNFEMESSALAGLAAQLGHDAGTVCLIIANRYAKEANPDYKALMQDLVKMALDKMVEL